MQMSYNPGAGIEAEAPAACLAKHKQVMSPSLQLCLGSSSLEKTLNHQVQP